MQVFFFLKLELIAGVGSNYGADSLECDYIAQIYWLVSMRHHLLLTFDVEDFIGARSIDALSSVLKLLEKHNISALFFITGHMAERLASFDEILDSLEEHEIGFHSSAHSVRPAIFEYCDVKSYEDAYRISLERETSHINPLSGKVEGKGGICTLRSLFSSKTISAYRAPGFCCPPPHLEAMATLGLRYDFSWSVSKVPVNYREITFYPRSIFLDCEKALLAGNLQIVSWALLARSVATQEMTVLDFHPHSLVSKDYWDSVFHMRNPSELKMALPRNNVETRGMLAKLEVLLKEVHDLGELGAIETSPSLMKSRINLDTDRLDRNKLANDLSFWPETFFGYRPKYTRSQLSRFFELDS